MGQDKNGTKDGISEPTLQDDGDMNQSEDKWLVHIRWRGIPSGELCNTERMNQLVRKFAGKQTKLEIEYLGRFLKNGPKNGSQARTGIHI